MAYQIYHILDFVLHTEGSPDGIDVTVNVDSHETATIEFGNSFRIRIDPDGVEDLRDALHRAAVQLESLAGVNPHFEEEWSRSNAEADMIQRGIDAREAMRGKTAPAEWKNPDDPANW